MPAVIRFVAGCVGGIWRQFLPATVIALLAALYVSSFGGGFSKLRELEEVATGVGLLLGSFIAVPVAGLYWSLRCTNFLVAWIGVAGTALVAPWCATWVWSVLILQADSVSHLLVFFVVQTGLSMVCGARLLANLSARRFVTIA